MATVSKLSGPIHAEQRFVLHGVSWEAYEKILEALGERRIRITYDRGDLEFMSPSNTHEWTIRLFDRLINALTEELNVPIRGCRCTTLRRKEAERGLEPDDSYYVQSEPLVRGKMDLNINRGDPPPDLAIEIDVTSSSIDRMGVYAGLGVPELWRYDGETLSLHRLESGTYRSADGSAAFPFLNPADLLPFLDLRAEMGETTLVRTFRQWVRDTFAAE